MKFLLPGLNDERFYSLPGDVDTDLDDSGKRLGLEIRLRKR
jgi:hypothetical protein